MLPARAGIGFKPQHFDEIISGADIGFCEVHAENYMGEGGLPHVQLKALREKYALSIHGVGLSIGGNQPLDKAHLARLKKLINIYQPESFSEHLAWSSHGENYFNDLLPIVYNRHTLQTVCDHIDEVQSLLQRRMLLENPSTYVAFQETDMSETEFIRAIAKNTGCGLLLDVNNVHVTAINHGLNAKHYLKDLPLEHVGEIHLAGFAEDEDDTGAAILIDAHDSPVRDVVWALYDWVISRIGAKPTLIEWDNDVPDWPALMAEASKANAILMKANYRVAS